MGTKRKTSDLIGAALDWTVAKCEGTWHGYLDADTFPDIHAAGRLNYSADWAQGGPIIERERIDTITDPLGTDRWLGRNYLNQKIITQYGPTPLIAAMRCYCCAKLGEFVDIPEELCQQESN